jgi:succinate dehydrogenase / fumarate reductase flavoprotein subunit
MVFGALLAGVPTNKNSEVIRDEQNTVVPGFYAAGEVACVSVHGANRLGTNSLVDILVFGRRAGLAMAKYCKQNDFQPLPKDPAEPIRAAISALSSRPEGEKVSKVRSELQTAMTDGCGVFRTQETLRQVQSKIAELKVRYEKVSVSDKSSVFNTDLLEAMELQNLIELAEVTVAGALARQESRGAHAREDFPKRDDQNWMKHTLAYATPKGVELRYKPVVITKFQPQERKY